MLAGVNWNDMPWEHVRDGVERKLFSGDGATLQLSRLMPGHEPRPHSHPNEQIAYILAGAIDFHVEDEVTRVSAGGLLRIPPDARHWGEVVGDEPVLNLDVFTPRRPIELRADRLGRVGGAADPLLPGATIIPEDVARIVRTD